MKGALSYQVPATVNTKIQKIQEGNILQEKRPVSNYYIQPPLTDRSGPSKQSYKDLESRVNLSKNLLSQGSAALIPGKAKPKSNLKRDYLKLLSS